MTEGITCYERDEVLCDDEMCLRVGCRLRNDRLGQAIDRPSAKAWVVGGVLTIMAAYLAVTGLIAVFVAMANGGN
jgi:hypothetical protein